MKETYILQMTTALKTMEKLQKKMDEVKLKLKNNPIDSSETKTLRELTLDITITTNEIETIQDSLDRIKKP
jgi:hypothetical protein